MGRGVVRLIGFVAVLAFGAAAFTPAAGVLARHWAVASTPGPADAVVVLGAGVDPNGRLSAHSLRRTVRGIRLYHRGLAPLLVLLGPSVEGSPAEAAVRAVLSGELGVRPDAILAVENAFTTREEARRVRELLAPRGARRILLVTDAQHLRRARALFDREGFEVLPVAAADGPEEPRDPEDRLTLARQVVEELAARLYNRLAGYL